MQDTTRPTWKRRLLISLIDLITLGMTLAACFLVFVMGAFASDSGTSAALTVSYTLIGVAGLYALVTVVALVFSQLRNSLKLALIPAILPALLLIWVIVI